MSAFATRTSAGRAALALLAVLAVGAAAPGAAEAKTFKGFIEDPEGDSLDGPRDIVSTRVAYNRRTGAISVTLTTAEPIDPEDHDAGFAVALSDLRGGKCRKTVLVIAGGFSQSDVVVGRTYNRGAMGPARLGTGTIDGSTYSLRVQHRSLAGRTVGCSVAGITSLTTSPTEIPTIYDKTKGDDGFL